MGQGRWRRQCLSLEGQRDGGLAVPGAAPLFLRSTGEAVHPGETSTIRKAEMLDPAIAAQLTDDDDPALWDVATNTILADAALTGRDTKDDVFVQIGSCRHWIRPHGSRWVADGEFFAAPFGYDKTTSGYSFRALPDLDWSVFFKWTRS